MGKPSNWPHNCAFFVLEYRARSGTVTSKAEFAPMTALNCPIMPQAKTVVEDGFVDVACRAEAETPPLAVVAQQTTPKAARGKTTALRLKRCLITPQTNRDKLSFKEHLHSPYPNHTLAFFFFLKEEEAGTHPR